MKLREAARITDGKLLWAGTDLELSGLAYDTRALAPGNLFFCIRGTRHDGHELAAEAIAAGAAALVCERPVELPGMPVPQVVVSDARAAMGRLASPFYGEPSRKLQVAGVTGTNGKTTTTFMLESIFRAAGDPAGLIGTVETRVAGRSSPARRTTPEAVDIQRLLKQMVDAGVHRCAMEITSIGIEGGRTQGLHLEAAVFTNLTQDHLDHHRTMERYYAAKRRMFTETPPAAAVINVDDAYGRRLLSEISKLRVPAVTFGMATRADLTVRDVSRGADGSRFTVTGMGAQARVAVPVPGRFNVSNALAAIATCMVLGVPLEAVLQGLESLRPVPGRFEPVDAGQPFLVVVDYAHTPDALAGVLASAREVAGEGRVLAVFGCGGDRDRSKRALMGRAAAEHADLVFATSDNPRSEAPGEILSEIAEGLRTRSSPGRYRIIQDRREAIRAALWEARESDVVVIAGKGHETGQEIGGSIHPFDDRLVARELLRELA